MNSMRQSIDSASSVIFPAQFCPKGIAKSLSKKSIRFTQTEVGLLKGDWNLEAF